jgi:hypothetical protein
MESRDREEKIREFTRQSYLQRTRDQHEDQTCWRDTEKEKRSGDERKSKKRQNLEGKKDAAYPSKPPLKAQATDIWERLVITYVNKNKLLISKSQPRDGSTRENTSRQAVLEELIELRRQDVCQKDSNNQNNEVELMNGSRSTVASSVFEIASTFEESPALCVCRASTPTFELEESGTPEVTPRSNCIVEH